MYVKLFVLLPFIIYSPTVKVLTKLTKPKKFKFLYVSLSDIVHDTVICSYSPPPATSVRGKLRATNYEKKYIDVQSI